MGPLSCLHTPYHSLGVHRTPIYWYRGDCESTTVNSAKRVDWNIVLITHYETRKLQSRVSDRLSVIKAHWLSFLRVTKGS